MSSGEEDLNERETEKVKESKKRRVQSQRACDRCRLKKVRCNGGQGAGKKCSNCEAYDFDCTYNEATKKRGPSKRYVDSLEARLEKMEDLLKKAYPESDDLLSQAGPSQETQAGRASSPSTEYYSEDDFEPSEAIQQKLSAMCLHPISNRFFGRSSGVMLLQTALDLKSEYSGIDQGKIDTTHGPHRKDSWAMHPWEIANFMPEQQRYDFPEADLLTHLVDLYFKYVNIFMPLLHRPTFERAVADGLQYHDEGFGSVLLLVCATASRYSSDPRVLLPGIDHWQSCGWRWFRQIRLTHRSIIAAGCLCDLQLYALSILFLHGCSPPHACWTTVGIGIRLAQDVGAHRRRMYSNMPNADDELLKRAFWVLIALDRWMSSILGRPCAISEEDFDVELPIDCDDEYWDHPDPEKRFKQPPGKPSIVSYFNAFLKLTSIHAYTLKTIYATNKSRVMHGYGGEEWEQHVVADLDSQLNSWVDNIPQHLRWDPTMKSHLWLAQSGSLYSSYYYLQIQIHRPFIPSIRKPSSLSFPSLAICTNAARACSNMTEVLRVRLKHLYAPNFQVPAFVAGVILLVSIWGAKRSGMSLDPAKEMQDVYKCIKLLNLSESRWHIAGRLRDLLCELATIGDLPLPEPSPPSHKRRAEDDFPGVGQPLSPASSSTAQSSPRADALSPDGHRVFAGSRRVMQSSSGQASYNPQPPMQQQKYTPPTPFDTDQDRSDSAGYSYLNTPTLANAGLRRTPGQSTASPPIAGPSYHFPPSDPKRRHVNGSRFNVDTTPGPSDTGAFTASPQFHAPAPSTTFRETGPAPLSMPPELDKVPGMSYFSQGTGPGPAAAPAPMQYQGTPTANADPLGNFPEQPFDPQDRAAFEYALQGLAADGQFGVDRDTMMMWSTLPVAVEGEDWDAFMSNAAGWSNFPNQQ